jgi:hypothetical protein
MEIVKKTSPGPTTCCDGPLESDETAYSTYQSFPWLSIAPRDVEARGCDDLLELISRVPYPLFVCWRWTLEST